MSKERFHEIVKEMVDLHDRKNRDYAGSDYLSNFLMCEKHMGIPGWKGCIVRLSDKMSRLMNIAKTDEVSVSDETVADTLTDLAIYAIITRILYENSKAGKVQKKDVIE
ncbi:MAG TPA: hypothetical protein VEK32_01990 [Thermodesulfobacteriota bacterium]|nr:hypothetical protein [Thermodesulfobacteriota bacterium]